MNYKRIILAVVGIVIVVGLGVFAIYKQNRSGVIAPVAEQKVANTPEPQKTDFGTSMPTDFPTDIPVEKGIKFEQSYGLNYAGQKQLTIVFQSTKTVKENYALYSEFLKKNNWNISNKYESPKLSSLYGAKENNDINVTISENSTTPSVKSQVSVSILKK